MKLTKTYNERYVPYASSLHVELYEDASDYYVMMKLQNDTNLEPFLINITGDNKIIFYLPKNYRSTHWGRMAFLYFLDICSEI